MAHVESYKNLLVWQKAVDFVTKIYKVTLVFPKSEQFGLTSQIRRSAVSIASNIAEGRTRSGSRDFHHFLIIAYASGAELETQLIIAKNLNFLDQLCYNNAIADLTEIMKMLNKLISIIKEKIVPRP